MTCLVLENLPPANIEGSTCNVVRVDCQVREIRCFTTMAMALSPTFLNARVLMIRMVTMDSAYYGPTSTTLAGPTSTSRTTRLRTSSTRTKGLENSVRLDLNPEPPSARMDLSKAQCA